MYSRWTQHLTDPEEQEKFKREIYSAKRVLDHLKEFIDEDKAALDRSEENQSIYGLPNWDYRQAHKNGIRQYMGEIYKLIDLDQQRK